MAESVTVTLLHKENYRFEVDFGEAFEGYLSDELPPLGKGEGAAPPHVLAAAVGNCLSASLLFVLQRNQLDAGGIETKVTCHIDRNENRRFRVKRIDVSIRLGKAGSNIEGIQQVIDSFEDVGTVSQSIKNGIPLDVSVIDGEGRRLK
jgi:organic hydroperoxide reductase OsmC/OhrA